MTYLAGDILPASEINNLDVILGSWTSYTPTLTNISLGNGTKSARYLQYGKTVWYRGQISWGSTTSASGDWNISLPVTPFVAPGNIGTVYAQDSSASVVQPGVAALFGSIVFFVVGTKNVSSTQPWTWATNDSLLWTIMYEVS